jgi:hypothetical protein
LEENFGIGLKEGIEGTQFEDHIGEDDVLETLSLAPTEIKGLIFWIPFQSHDAEVELGKERKFSYLMYFVTPEEFIKIT